jgi:pimeloyl-ACP methyl ester carboxylesterase
MVWLKRILLGGLLILIITGAFAYQALGTFQVSISESFLGNAPGDIVEVKRIGRYPRYITKLLWDSADLPVSIEVEYGIAMYQLQYRTTNQAGLSVVASGLVTIPLRYTSNSVVAYFHGTDTERDTAPSQPGIGEGLLVSVSAAGSGHILAAPDYLGLGLSLEAHPYMVTHLTVSAAIDFLRATYSFIEQLNGEQPNNLFLTGWSQGGHATLAVQRELEVMDNPPFEVSATAPISGAFYLRDMSFPQALTGEAEAHVMYVAYLATSYSKIYSAPLNTVLAEPYVDSVIALFDGNHSTREIVRELPDDPRELLDTRLLDALDNGESHWFLNALQENSLESWTPVAPVRLYYGEADVDVLPEESRRAETELKVGGGNITALSIGAYNHEDAPLYAIPDAIDWFTEATAN